MSFVGWGPQNAPREVAMNRGVLNEIYLRYQAAMHITRAMVWYAPHLDSPILRQRKIAIIADDDALNGKASHHQQVWAHPAFQGSCPRSLTPLSRLSASLPAAGEHVPQLWRHTSTRGAVR